MRSADLFIYLDDVQYEKREFQNRNRIRTARGWQYLTAPVLSKGRFSQKISEVELDNSTAWRQEHLLALKTNYSRAPFFREYFPELEKLYAGEYRLLAEVSMATAGFIAKKLGLNVPAKLSSSFKVEETSSVRLVSLCAAAGAGEYLSGSGARAYLDAAAFSRAGIKLLWQEFTPREYPQAFPGFEKDMSALDLLLNCGPRSVEWL